MAGLLCGFIAFISLHLIEAGEYCRAYFDNHLKYHHGFYCDHFCCGKAKHKYCCNFVSFRYDGQEDIPRSIDVTSWNSTFWIMVGCILGTVFLIGSVMLFVFCVCCKHDTTQRALTDNRLQALLLFPSLHSFLERRCSAAQTTTEPGGADLTRGKSITTSNSQYTKVQTDDTTTTNMEEKQSPPTNNDIFTE